MSAPKPSATAKTAKTVDHYLSSFDVEVRARLAAVRAAIRKAAPGAQEGISYRIPSYKMAGRPLIYFAGFKGHIGLYPVTDDVSAALARAVAPYRHGKGTVRFPHDEPLPVALIVKIVAAKLRKS